MLQSSPFCGGTAHQMCSRVGWGVDGVKFCIPPPFRVSESYLLDQWKMMAPIGWAFISILSFSSNFRGALQNFEPVSGIRISTMDGYCEVWTKTHSRPNSPASWNHQSQLFQITSHRILQPPLQGGGEATFERCYV